MNHDNIHNNSRSSNTSPVLLIPANKTFTKLNGFATLYGIEYSFVIDGVRLESRNSAIAGTQDDEDDILMMNTSVKKNGWEHANFITNSTTTKIILSLDFLNTLKRSAGDTTIDNDNDEYIQGFKKTIFQSSTIYDCKIDLNLYLHQVELKKNMDNNNNNTSGLSKINSTNNQISYPSAPFYNRIIEELNAVGWEYLIGVHDSMQRLELQTLDRAGRKHTFDVVLNSTLRHDGTIALKTILQVNIPSLLKNNNDGSMMNEHDKSTSSKTVNGKVIIVGNDNSSLRDLIDNIEKELNRFQTFWDVMDDFDDNLWVLEPQNPSRSSNIRRIAVQESCSMHVKIDPSNPKRICECDFMGKDSIVEPLRKRLHTNIDQWNYKATPRENLQNLLKMQFPDPKISENVDFRVECGVCYSYRRTAGGGDGNGNDNNVETAKTVHLPDFICNACGQAFHQLCVSEWLQSVPSTRRSFNMLFGSCPYCNAAVSVGV